QLGRGRGHRGRGRSKCGEGARGHPPSLRAPRLDEAGRAMHPPQVHPFVRNVVIGVVGLLIAGGLTAMAIFADSPTFSVAAMLASTLIAVAIGVFLFIQGWI